MSLRVTLRAVFRRAWRRANVVVQTHPADGEERRKIMAQQERQMRDIERLTASPLEALRAEARVLGRHVPR